MPREDLIAAVNIVGENRQFIRAAEQSGRATREMGRDVRKLDKDLGRLDKQANKTGVSFGELAAGTTVGFAAGAAIVGAAQTALGILREQREFADQLISTSLDTGFGLQELQQYALVGQTIGVDFDNASEGLKSFSERVGEARLEGGGFAELFDLLGVRIETADGKARDIKETFDDFLGVFRQIQDPGVRLFIARDIFGDEDSKFLQAFLDGKFEERMERINNIRVFSDGDVQAIRDINAEIDLLGAEAKYEFFGTILENKADVLGFFEDWRMIAADIFSIMKAIGGEYTAIRENNDRFTSAAQSLRDQSPTPEGRAPTADEAQEWFGGLAGDFRDWLFPESDPEQLIAAGASPELAEAIAENNRLVRSALTPSDPVKVELEAPPPYDYSQGASSSSDFMEARRGAPPEAESEIDARLNQFIAERQGKDQQREINLPPLPPLELRGELRAEPLELELSGLTEGAEETEMALAKMQDELYGQIDALYKAATAAENYRYATIGAIYDLSDGLTNFLMGAQGFKEFLLGFFGDLQRRITSAAVETAVTIPLQDALIRTAVSTGSPAGKVADAPMPAGKPTIGDGATYVFQIGDRIDRDQVVVAIRDVLPEIEQAVSGAQLTRLKNDPYYKEQSRRRRR